ASALRMASMGSALPSSPAGEKRHCKAPPGPVNGRQASRPFPSRRRSVTVPGRQKASPKSRRSALMSEDELPNRLSQIQTYWKGVLEGHQKEGPQAQEALRGLLLRYYGAVYRYLLGMLKDAERAQELTQEFAVRFLQGGFRNADPGKGRFRDFLKT